MPTHNGASVEDLLRSCPCVSQRDRERALKWGPTYREVLCWRFAYPESVIADVPWELVPPRFKERCRPVWRRDRPFETAELERDFRRWLDNELPFAA